MPTSFTAKLLRSPGLNRVGQLMDATRLIQRTLAGLSAKAPGPAARSASRPARQGLVIDAVLREINPAGDDSEFDLTPAPPARREEQARAPTSPASFKSDVFANAGMSHPYRVYVPSGAQADAESLPLVVLLHGCTQTATDFALGTAMNQLAEETRCIVLYPEQVQRANSSRCWNWFEPQNQKRDSGEPGMIAALTRQVMATHNIDASRVYITGLSAGGAMAAVVAGLYPDLFAAVGVHSGLPCGAAHDMASAFSAMRSGAPVKGKPGRALPTIVFHGTADKTVHPDNGENIVNAAAKAAAASGLTLAKTEKQHDGSGARTARRTRYTAPDGTAWIEHWEVASGPHGWSGGDTAGSYTDPTGPSASAAMLEFFLQHKLNPAS
ncbi:PHB depolymerase family esterase [soil metagenome]